MTKRKFGFMDFACFAVLTAIAMAGMVIFVYREGWLIDSDLASELMLSFKLNEEGGILSHNWIYSTELRVFETQWFYRIGALLFPHNWSRARLVALMLMMPVMGFSSYLFAKSAGFGRFAKLFSFFLLMPIGHGYFFYTIWGLYYQPYFIFIYLTLACLFASYQRMEKGGTPVFLTAAASVLALMSGCNGFRQMQVQYLPLLVAAFVLLAMDTRKHAHSVKELPVKCRKTFFTFLLAFDLCVFNFIGILINRFLSSQYTFRTFNDIRLLEGHERSYASLFWDYLSLFGYQGNLSLFTADGIGSVFGIVLAFCVVFSAVRIGWKYSSRSFTSQFCFVLFCSELAVNLTVFRFLDYYSYHHQLPMLPLGIALIVLELKEEPTVLRATRPLAVACVTLMLIICSAVAVDYEVKNPTWADRDREELAEWMVDSGIHQAAASFWESNVLTELSNGQIEMWTLSWGRGRNIDREKVEPLTWLQDSSHIEHFPEGKVYVIFNEAEDAGVSLPLLAKGKAIHEVGVFQVWEFESAEDVFEKPAETAR